MTPTLLKSDTPELALQQTQQTSLQPPLISIITINFNAADALEKTIESVLAQSYTNIEYIVIDGGSTDASRQVIAQYKSKLKYWISEADHGIYDAINKGLVQAQGDLVNILNSGDCYAPNILETVSMHYQNHGFQIALCDYFWVYPNRQLRISRNPQILKKGDAVCHQAVFYQRRLHEEFGNYNLSYPLAADYHFIRRVYDQYGMDYIPKAACFYSLGGVSEIAFMDYANEIRQICYNLKDPFWRIEWSYWSKYIKFLIRYTLKQLRLESLLFVYRRFKHPN